MIIQKTLIPYNKIANYAECLLALGQIDAASKLLSIKKDIYDAYGEFYPNFGILLIVYEVGIIDAKMVRFDDCCL